MDKLRCFWIIIVSIIFGMGDRTINAIIHDYSIDSLVQILIGGVLLLLVSQLYPYNH
jgi:hypothetical protein